MNDALVSRARQWISDDPDARTAEELSGVIARGDEKDLAERMAGPLEFGTAGLRGVLGAGESRMNRAVVLRTSHGLARYVLEAAPGAAEKGVVVGYDGRHQSRVFAEDTARVLAAQGIVAHLFTHLGPTPLTAFALKELGAAAAVMVTASHNPPEYNGYKVYWSDGAQIIPPHDAGIAAKIAEAPGARAVPAMDLAEARAKNLVRDVPASLVDRYFAAVDGLVRDRRGRDGVRIVYTPLHGTGEPFTPPALRRAGFAHVTSVAEQKDPDPDFSTVRFPNPEEPGALDLAYRTAREQKATLVLANDPDSDRLSVAVPDATRPDGYRQLSGNEVGVLLGEYLLRTRPEGGSDRLVVTTVVSSPALGHIASVLGVRYAETLTGFKWIAAAAMREETRGATFVFGYEEALGYTVSTVVRDKDGVSAAVVFAELAAAANAEGRTVDDELARIARTYGLFVSGAHNVTRKGTSGAAEIAAMMDGLRARLPARIGVHDVLAVRDVGRGVRIAGGATTPLDLPKSNVLAFDLAGGSRVIARPSGTEPKIKYYFDVREPIAEGEDFGVAKARAEATLEALRAAFLEIAGG